MHISIFSEHFNVLYRKNWTAEASKVIRKFELDVIRKAKNEGYDGQDVEGSDVTSQWDFSGALLYSVTVITTIGKVSPYIWLFNHIIDNHQPK